MQQRAVVAAHLALFIALGGAGYAATSSAETPKPLTVKVARYAVRVQAESTIGQLLYRSVGSAFVRVSGCRVSGLRGRCAVLVRGTSRCTYTAHVRRLTSRTAIVYGDRLRCAP